MFCFPSLNLSSFLGQWYQGRSVRRSRTSGGAQRVVAEITTLEARRLLAGTTAVTFAAGVLTLTCVDDLTQDGILDGMNDNVIELVGGAVGQVSLVAGDEVYTGVAGPFAGVTKINIIGKEGDDSVQLTNVNITGAVTVNGGNGNNSVQGDGGSLGSLSITNLDGFDDTEYRNATIVGAVTISNGDGGLVEEFEEENSDGSVLLLGTMTIGILSVTSLEGYDSVSIEGNTTINGATTIKTGVGGSDFVGGGEGTLKGALTITNGDGSDYAELRFVSTKAITITNGDGGSSTLLSTSSPIIGNVSIANLDGNDEFHMGEGATNITGNLTISNGNGGSTTDLFTNITGNLSVSGLAGHDAVTASEDLRVTGTTTFSFGTGDSEVILDNSGNAGTLNIGGALTVTSKDGDDTFMISSSKAIALKAVTINSGLGDSSADFSSFVSIAMDAVSLTGSSGDHYVTFAGPAVATNNVTLNFKGDAYVYGSADLMTINGNLAATLSSSNSSSLFFIDTLNVTGTTTVKLGAGDDFVGFIGGGTLTGAVTITGNAGSDDLSMVGMTVVGNLSSDLGTGDDFVSVDNSIFKGTVTLTLGAGDDRVNVEQQDIGIETRFEKAVKVTGGAGRDHVSVGLAGDQDDFARFLSTVTVDGGLGIDKLFALPIAIGGTRSNIFTSLPALVGFEVKL